MDVQKMAMKKPRAYELWKEYVNACKHNPQDKFLKDMKAIYNQLKSGRKVIDIIQVFEKSGLNVKAEPRLAIGQATSKQVVCIYNRNGLVKFLNRDEWSEHAGKEDVVIRNVFPELPENLLPRGESSKKL